MECGVKRVLCILSNMNAGGAETFLMKLYRALDRTCYQMDFCLTTKEKCYYEEEILSLGGRIHRIQPKSENAGAFARQLRDVVRRNGYTYVFKITSNGMGFWDLKIAKKGGARVCVARSSNSNDSGGWKSAVMHRLGRLLYGKYIDVKIAPSDLAAIYTFGRRVYESNGVKILHNAVNVDTYAFSEESSKAIRAELGIREDTVIVGHVGRFMKQKNHAFLLRVFREMKARRENLKLLLVGNGILEEELRAQCEEMGIQEDVIFTGVRSDIPALLSAMNVFVFPSLYEGMPNTVIEAQASGLPCLIADTITREADITGLVKYMALKSDAGRWADAALSLVTEQRRDTRKDFCAAGYEIETAAREFVKLVFHSEESDLQGVRRT